MITVVSGLPRSGTSLMMQILANSGYEILTDGIRTADENNHYGYYEFEKVKSLKADNSWMAEAEGKVVKIITQLLPYIPAGFEYNIFYMERNIDEIIASQNKMLARLNKNAALVDSNAIKTVFQKQSELVKKQMESRNDVKMLEVSYNNLLKSDDKEINSLIVFSNYRLEKDKIQKTINPVLYREKL